MKRRLQFLHLLGRALGIHYNYHVRTLRPGLKRMEPRGRLVGTRDEPVEALQLLQVSAAEAKVKGHYFLQVEARPAAIHVNPRQRSAEPE